jgi:hypothetical protein
MDRAGLKLSSECDALFPFPGPQQEKEKGKRQWIMLSSGKKSEDPTEYYVKCNSTHTVQPYSHYLNKHIKCLRKHTKLM